jgi:hypothetical protein
MIYPNGISGITGQYAIGPLNLNEARAVAAGQRPDRRFAQRLRAIAAALKGKFLGLPDGVDPTRVSQAGWGIVFHRDASSEIRESLADLTEHRRKAVLPGRCKLLEYAGESDTQQWLKRYSVYSGSISPAKVPYYLLLIGSPEEIPFEFQFQLGLEYAVGRLDFNCASEYHQYAKSLIAYETMQDVPGCRKIAFWGTRHADDAATQLSADLLIHPLCDVSTESDPTIADELLYSSSCFIGPEKATKSNLLSLFRTGCSATPVMLFTASHGLDWPLGSEQQRRQQGALLCQDWPGFGTPPLPRHFLCADDLTDELNLHGLVAFLFACHGAGTPKYDSFPESRTSEPKKISETAFTAALAQRMLAHPNGSALAVIGHVERAWGYSILQPGVGPQLVPYRNLVSRVLKGSPVGYALKPFSERYAILSAQLLSKLDTTQGNPLPHSEDLVWLWIERNDAQNYVLIGDPAARLRAEKLQVC